MVLDPVTRSPFVPIKKHSTSTNNSFSNSPPPSPSPSSPSPLQPSSVHNYSLSIHPPSPQQQQPQQPPPSRIRAKLTPSATPRKKVLLPGTEFADAPPSRSISSPSKPSSTPSSLHIPSSGKGLPSWPPSPRSVFSNKNSQNEEILSKGLAGLGLGGMPTIEEQKSFDSSATVLRSSKSRMGDGGKENVLVCVRVRPPAAKLASAAASSTSDVAWDTSSRNGKILLNGTLPGGSGEFNFDAVVTGTDNEGVYQAAGRDLVLASMEGFDAVIFAYGQTASGKTFTLTGNAQNPGIIPQAVSEIFTFIRDHPEQEFLLRASYLEIYNETLKDLLAPESGALKIRQDEKKKFFVDPLREEVVTNEFQVAALLSRGERNRHVGRTDFNERSSRSHSVFQITIESRQDDGSGSNFLSSARSTKPNGPRLAGASVKISKLSLIDLAGSEQATSQTERRSEGSFINKSLLTLEKVIASLTEDCKKKPHVPYRDSKLTQILQPSLAGDARVAVIATMNPSPSAVEETKSTLKFAQRVKKVALSAKINEVIDDKALIVKYQSQIEDLSQRLKDAEAVAAEAVNSAQSPVSQKRPNDSRVLALRSEMAEIKALFLRSDNVENRRHSLLPPRPVSPVKPRHGVCGTTPQESEELVEEEERPPSPTWEDKYFSSQDEVAALQSENEDLKRRLAEMDEDRLRVAEGDSDHRVSDLIKQVQELQVITQNMDPERELIMLKRAHEREVKRHTKYADRLRQEIEAAKQKTDRFEKFLLDHIRRESERLSESSNSRRRSSIAPIGGAGAAAFGSLMAESPDLDAFRPHSFGDSWDVLEFSEGNKQEAQIVRSTSRMFFS